MTLGGISVCMQGTSFFWDVKGEGVDTNSVKPERCEEKCSKVSAPYKRSCLHQYGFDEDYSFFSFVHFIFS